LRVLDWSVGAMECCDFRLGIAGQHERRTFNAQHRMLNVKTKRVIYWKFDVGRSMLNVH
jgi:hypothetical protein